MAYHIIWKNPDGSLKITNMHSAATLDETSTHKDILVARGETSVFQSIISSEQLPQDRYFREAWRWDAGALELNLPACKQRHLDKLRRIRDVKLQESDADMLRATEQGDQIKVDALKTYRQALRNMPQTAAAEFANARTPNEIKAIRPNILDTNKP